MKRDVVIGLVAAVVVIAAGLTALRWSGGPSAPPPGGAPPPAASQASPPATAPSGPSFDVVRVNPAGDAVIAGRAEPGAEVTVLDGGKVLGKVTANENGEWVLLPTEKLSPGSHELSLSARTADGATSTSEGVVAMLVPPSARPGAPSSAPSESVAVLVPRQGLGAPRALQLPRDAAGARRKLALDVIEYDSSGKVQLLGRAEPGARVEAYLDDRPAGTATAEAGGGWGLLLDRPVPVGQYRLRLEAFDAKGQKLAQIALNFGRVAPPEGAVAVDIQPGNNLWRIAQRSYGDGLRYTEIYQANRTQIRDPNLIYPGQVFSVPTPSR